MKALVFILVISLVCLIGYTQFIDGTPKDEKTAIALAVEKVKQERQLKPEEEALLTVQLAIVDHMAKNSAPPSSLQELVPKYFGVVPIDPATGKELAYERNGKEYRIGRQVLMADTANATANLAGTLTVASANGLSIATDAEFINPNTLAEDLFVYDPSGKRDPFRPFDFSNKEQKEGLSRLEQLEIGELRVSAIVGSAERGRKAMVEDQAGMGYTVTVGSKIGPNGGEVIEISETSMKILETAVDIAGRVQQNIIEKKIMKSNEEVSQGNYKSGVIKIGPSSNVKGRSR